MAHLVVEGSECDRPVSKRGCWRVPRVDGGRIGKDGDLTSKAREAEEIGRRHPDMEFSLFFVFFPSNVTFFLKKN